MDTFITHMDQHQPKNIGENGHLQHGWSNNAKNKLCELYFQLVRSKDHTDLEKQWRQIISKFINKNNTIDKALIPEFINVIKMVANVRDVVDGKGEQKLSFMLLYVLSEYFPSVAKYLFIKFIIIEDGHCFGSTKDIKYFCNYIRNRSGNSNHDFINYIINISCDLLRVDATRYANNQSISLLAKWFPRAKSKKFGWINKKACEIYYSNIMSTTNNIDRRYRGKRKCETLLRKLLSKLNKFLDTPQIKMAGNDWASIDFNKVTGPTLRIHKKAFQNLDKNNLVRSHTDDRISCATNLKTHLQNAIEGKTVVKGKRVDMYKLVKDALNVTTQDDINMVNEQWKDNSSINKETDHYIIPMSDTSGSMSCDDNIPMYNSIGFGIRISEKTHPAFRHRIMTFSTNPTWFQLNEDMTFHQKVNVMKNDNNWGGSTNFYKAMEMILNVCIENDVPPNEVSKMILAIFSDMQIDVANENGLNMTTMMENIKMLYIEAGLKTKWKQPYPVPHILFWNLKKTNGFPSTVYEKNTSMISGYSPVLLNTFTNKGVKDLKETTPYSMLIDILDNSRYNFINNFISKYYS